MKQPRYIKVMTWDADRPTWYSFLINQVDKNMKLQSHIISNYQKHQIYGLHQEFQLKNKFFSEEVKAKQNFQVRKDIIEC